MEGNGHLDVSSWKRDAHVISIKCKKFSNRTQFFVTFTNAVVIVGKGSPVLKVSEPVKRTSNNAELKTENALYDSLASRPRTLVFQYGTKQISGLTRRRAAGKPKHWIAEYEIELKDCKVLSKLGATDANLDDNVTPPVVLYSDYKFSGSNTCVVTITFNRPVQILGEYPPFLKVKVGHAVLDAVFKEVHEDAVSWR
jgi:hypothetical protein